MYCGLDWRNPTVRVTQPVAQLKSTVLTFGFKPVITHVRFFLTNHFKVTNFPKESKNVIQTKPRAVGAGWSGGVR